MWNEFSEVMFSDVLQASNNRMVWQDGVFFIFFIIAIFCQLDLCYRRLGKCWTVTRVNMSVKFCNLHQWGCELSPSCRADFGPWWEKEVLDVFCAMLLETVLRQLSEYESMKLEMLKHMSLYCHTQQMPKISRYNLKCINVHGELFCDVLCGQD